ncbi:hypothetical protein CJ739_3856 [Mariniflexile rhizosphaerae]|uniref:DUF2490 domain-containing protein n=1 Tax=unclassified Mariniflexile TaxID=2643887 RepID=UPI000E32FF29|nr:DUF2490 domain-containing protein [Mariniflexile sp. TRM1-10]AXP82915.1 hypothetical protein CJ739_3856 [Mariniflexile sp. TRM1-10]
MKTITAFIALALAMPLCQAQKTPESSLGAWYMLDATHAVSNKIGIKTGVQLRSYEVFNNINLLFVYTGINYKISKNTTFTLTYGYLDIDRTFTDIGFPHLYENRIYEQLSYKHKLNKLPISHRLRIAHRFLNFAHKLDTKHRLRYCLGSKIALTEDYFLNVNNEFFANLKKDTARENRLYAAVGLNISKTNNIQLGYLNHKINGLNLHRLQVGIFIKTDLRKKL